MRRRKADSLDHTTTLQAIRSFQLIVPSPLTALSRNRISFLQHVSLLFVLINNLCIRLNNIALTGILLKPHKHQAWDFTNTVSVKLQEKLLISWNKLSATIWYHTILHDIIITWYDTWSYMWYCSTKCFLITYLLTFGYYHLVAPSYNILCVLHFVVLFYLFVSVVTYCSAFIQLYSFHCCVYVSYVLRNTAYLLIVQRWVKHNATQLVNFLFYIHIGLFVN